MCWVVSDAERVNGRKRGAVGGSSAAGVGGSGGMGGEARNKQGLMCLYYSNL